MSVCSVSYKYIHTHRYIYLYILGLYFQRTNVSHHNHRSIMRTPPSVSIHHRNINYSPSSNTIRSRKSIESPYTSLGSAHSSYTSIKHGNYDINYGSLRAKAEKANVLHNTRSKGLFSFILMRSRQKAICCMEHIVVKFPCFVQALKILETVF